MAVPDFQSIVTLIEASWQDILYGTRMLRRNPGFTAAAVVTLALSIGANTALFSVVNAVLIRPLPYSDPSSLVYLKYDYERIGITPYAVALEFVAWRNQSQTLAQLGAYMDSQGNLTGGGEAERVDYGFVTSSFFPMLGVQPMLGRNFTPEEDRPGGQPAMILSHNLWKRNFGGDPSIVGKAADLDGKSYAIVGVLSATFQLAGRYGGDAADLWMPFAINEADGITLRATPLRAVGRLKPGVSLERARAELDTILQSTISKRRPTKKRLILTPWHEEVARGVKVPLLVFLAAVGFVLLIACVNVANLLLARAAARQKEIAIRRAVGAGRTRIVRQLLTESVLMALLGGTIGLAVAYWGKDLLVSFISTNLPAMSPVEMDYRVLAFNLSLAFLTGLAFGLAPALLASGIRVNESLKGNRPAIEGRVHQRLSTLLVVSEIALALVLLVGAGLLMKSFIRLRSVDPGFRSDQILSLTIDLTPSAYPHSRDQTAFFQQVTERIKALPRVEAVGLNACLPLSGHYMLMTGVTVEGRPPESDETFSPIYFTTVNSEYFRAVNISLLRGRFFTESDASDAPGVAIIDDTFARRYFPGTDPIGKQMKTPFQRNEILTIVGVVGNVRSTGLEKEAPPLVYRSYLQAGFPLMSMAVRTAGDPMKLAAAVRSQIANVDRDQPPHDIMTLEQRLAGSISPHRVNMLLFGSFAGLALVLASVGIYGVVSYTVAQRTHEIGVRLALGAQRRDVLKIVVGRALALCVVGLIAGLAAAFGLTRLISSMLFGVTATDLATFAAVSFLMIGVVLIASYLPFRKAAKIDPMAALRSE